MRLKFLFTFLLCLGFVATTFAQKQITSGELKTLDGATVDISDYLDDADLTIISFWATWCKICEFEQSWINDIEKDWTVLTVVTLSPDTEEDIRRYLKRHNIEHWQVIMDKNNSFAEHYVISVLPSTFVIDSHGEIRFKEVGVTTPWGWRLRLWFTDLIDG